MGRMIFNVVAMVVAGSLVVCVFLVLRKHAALRAASPCEGIVTAHLPDRDSDGDTTYALEISYRDGHGEPHRFTTKLKTNPPTRAVGDRVTVLHSPDGSPASLLVFAHLYLGYWLWFCAGVFVTGWWLAPRLLAWLYVQPGV